jgi:DNA-binding transcriptional MerR regulator
LKYQIGDFSKISRLSVKTLRYYHECGLLEPAFIEKETGYRYYDEKNLQRVKIINMLKELEFPLKDIKEILDKCSEDYELADYMRDRYKNIGLKILEYQKIQNKIESFMDQIIQRGESEMVNSSNEIIIKDISDIMIVSERFKGKYSDVGIYFKKFYKECGRFISGYPFSMYYDKEYKDEEADIEVCVQVRKNINSKGLISKTLKGGKAVSILHRGPYETLGDSYKVILDYVNANNISIVSPSRELYIKGPGVIIPRSAKKYLTEIQMFILAK